ncbi:MAG TPA: HEAT repeat domain-containing protein, partial [Anaerolineales bacterium]|nr:HEAT repeat domain-containing protein [Anaerolineales bacterium]
VGRLSDEHASVRAAAISALADLDAKAVFHEIILGLDDPDDAVREETLASLPRLGIDSSPELVRKLEQMLNDKNFKISSHASVVLIYLGEIDAAKSFLLKLLQSDDVEERLTALDAIGHIAGNVDSDFPIDVDFVLDLLDDPSPILRRDAIQVLSVLNETSDLELVIACLADEDAWVRKEASEFLRQVWPESRTGIIRILDEMNQRSLDAALDVVPPGDPEMLDVLRGYIQREVSNIGYLRALENSFAEGGQVVTLLAATLHHRELLSEERLIKAVGLFGNRRALEIVRKRLNAGDTSTRAAALEALETLGDPVITKEVIPILDRGGVFTTDDEQKMDVSLVIGGLLESEDYWLRAISARVVSELELIDYVPTLEKMKSDPVPLVEHAARNALAGLDNGAKMKTLRTLSTLDRILLMREIPMFSRLSPEDLERIAEVAVEQLFPSGSFICHEGEHGDSLFIIVHGDVNVLKNTGSDQTILAVRKDGEFVGEMAILESPSVRSATLQAATDVRMLVLDGESFKVILRDRPEVAISVLEHMSRRVRDLIELVGAQQ